MEVCLSLAFTVMLALQLHNSFLPIVRNWQTVQEHLLLDQAQQYMFNKLEYELSQNSLVITVSQEGQQLKCQTLNAMQQLTFSREYINQRNGLYLTVKNAKGTSKNPLFLPEAQLLNWKATILSPKQLAIELCLGTKSCQKSYSRVIFLLNGTIEGE